MWLVLAIFESQQSQDVLCNMFDAASDRYQPMEIEGKQLVPQFPNSGAGIGESNKILSEIKDLLQQQGKTEENIELTVVSSNAVADAGKILNDITKPF